MAQTIRIREEDINNQRHEVFITVLQALNRVPSLPTIADSAGVSVQTLYYWMQGPTVHPNTRTLFAVAEALGYKIVLKRTTGRRGHLQRVK